MMESIAVWPEATTTRAFAAPLRRTWEDDDVMRGLMMDYPLTLTQFFERTRRLFHRKTMATRVPGVGLQRYTYGDYAERVCRLAGALRGLGLQKGARVGTFAWNSHRHMEVYFGRPSWALCSTPSTSGSRPRTSPTSSTTRATRC